MTIVSLARIPVSGSTAPMGWDIKHLPRSLQNQFPSGVRSIFFRRRDAPYALTLDQGEPKQIERERSRIPATKKDGLLSRVRECAWRGPKLFLCVSVCDCFLGRNGPDTMTVKGNNPKELRAGSSAVDEELY